MKIYIGTTVDWDFYWQCYSDYRVVESGREWLISAKLVVKYYGKEYFPTVGDISPDFPLVVRHRVEDLLRTGPEGRLR